MDLQETLDKRLTQHGPFKKHAHIEAALRNTLVRYGIKLNDVEYIALGMIIHKIARILNGGHQHSDTWHDIAGYAVLVEQNILNE